MMIFLSDRRKLRGGDNVSVSTPVVNYRARSRPLSAQLDRFAVAVVWRLLWPLSFMREDGFHQRGSRRDASSLH
jgi:hypothetical protein